MPPVQAKVGFLKLIIGATPVAEGLQADLAKSGKAMSEATKRMQAVQYSMITGAMVGIAAVTFELVKAIQASAAFESAFAGIRKTVEASDKEFSDLAQNILRMSTAIPVSAQELSRIGELGGQLGIAVQNLPEFIATVSTLATTTNLTVDNAALGLARLDAIAQTNGETFSNLASTIVDLGNNFAATESEIMTTVLRIAQAAAQVGATTQDALAFATALQAIGVPAQAGGTAVARVFQSIQSAIIQAGDEADMFSKVAARSGKVSSEGFAQMFGEDPAMAAAAFIEGLAEMNKSGEDTMTVLEKLGLSQRRTTLAILGLAEAGDLLPRVLETGRTAFEENTAATDEAIKRYTTLEAQLQITKNAFNELQVSLGDQLMPIAKGFNDVIQETILGFREFNLLLPTLIGLTTGFSLVILRALNILMPLVKRVKQLGFALRLALTGPVGWIAAIVGALTIFAVKIMNARGEAEQLQRTLEAFAQDGEVTKNTIKALTEVTNEYAKALNRLQEEDRREVRGNIIEGLAGTPGERVAYLNDLDATIEKNKELIDVADDLLTQGMGVDLRNAVRNGTIKTFEEFQEFAEKYSGYLSTINSQTEEQMELLFKAFQSSDYRKYLNDAENGLKEQNRLLEIELKIAKEIAAATTAYEKERDQKIRNDAMEALGIKRLADFGSGLREMQESQIKAYIEKNKQLTETEKALQAEKEAILQLDTVYSTVTDNMKKSTDSFVQSFESLPDVTLMTAEEMAKNFAERLALAEIFKSQMKQLETLELDDLGLLASTLGPEFAPQLQELLSNPEIARAIEAGLEGQRITASEKLKENTEKVRATYGDEFENLGKDIGGNLMIGAVLGLEGEEQIYYEAIDRIISEGIVVANDAAGNRSPSRKTARISKFMMLGFVKGIKDNYPALETEFKDTMIDLVNIAEQSVNDAMSRVQTVFGSQFSLFGSQKSLLSEEKKYNDLLIERDKLLQGNSARQVLAIREAQDKVDFLRIAYAEGTISAEELAVAEEELAEAQNARQTQLNNVNRQIEDSQISQAESMMSLANQAFQILQLGPEGINQFKKIAEVLGIDSGLIETVTGKTEKLANTIGKDFAGVINDFGQDYFNLNMKMEQEEITIKADASQANNALSNFINNYVAAQNYATENPIVLAAAKAGIPMGAGGMRMYAGGGRIPMFANGGTLRSGLGLVGEYGPEMVRAIPGGGVDITPIGNHGRSTISISNLNVNVVGVPSDPSQARKAAIEIRKALHRLDREGLVGTGIRGR